MSQISAEANLGNWSGPPNNSDEEEDFISFSSADAEYFAAANLNSLESVGSAINSCKKSILDTTENTENRKNMVNRLIQLQILQEDLKEKQELSQTTFETRGHTFVNYQIDVKIPGMTDFRQGVYCQQCATVIWISLQSSQFCTACGFGAHYACMDNIMRTCVAIKAKTQPDFIMDICPERILPQLKYRCVECDKKFCKTRPPRLCDYTGLSFCPGCHWNAMCPTPARIVHNWDFEAHPVSQATKQYLFLMLRKPVIDINATNPKLSAVVEEVAKVTQLRSKIMLMKNYLTLCRIASKEKLLLILVSRQHFVDGALLYSLQDLIDIKNGFLLPFLETATSVFEEHIKSCLLCKAKGFVCEICNIDDVVLFPFDKEAEMCPQCQGAFHRDCYRQHVGENQQECVRCLRIKAKKANKEAAKNQL